MPTYFTTVTLLTGEVFQETRKASSRKYLFNKLSEECFDLENVESFKIEGTEGMILKYTTEYRDLVRASEELRQDSNFVQATELLKRANSIKYRALQVFEAKEFLDSYSKLLEEEK